MHVIAYDTYQWYLARRYKRKTSIGRARDVRANIMIAANTTYPINVTVRRFDGENIVLIIIDAPVGPRRRWIKALGFRVFGATDMLTSEWSEAAKIR